jgi:O-Antigen ligase
MARVAATALVGAYVVSLPFGLYFLRANVQAGDLLFPFAALAVYTAGWRPRWQALDFFVVAYLIGSIASVPWSLSPNDSSLAILKELYLVGIYLLIATAAPQIGVLRLCRWLAMSMAVFCAASLAAAAVFFATKYAFVPLGEPMILPYAGDVFRVRGTLHSPELFGNFLTFIAPLALVRINGLWPSDRFRLAALGLFAIAEILTVSRSLGGFAVALAVMLWTVPGRRSLSRFAVATVVILLVAAVNVTAWIAIRDVEVQWGRNPRIAVPPYGQARQETGADMLEVRVSYNPISYYVIKQVEWNAFLRRPWTGIGLGAFPFEAERAYNEGRLFSPYQRVEPHSTPFGRLAETGLAGFVPLVLLVSACAIVARRAVSGPAPVGDLALAIAAGCLGLLVNGINVDIMNFRFLWFGAALLRAIPMRTSSPLISTPLVNHI